MYKCLKCNKEFKFESELNRHKNRKNPCNNQKKNISVIFVMLNLFVLLNKQGMKKLKNIF